MRRSFCLGCGLLAAAMALLSGGIGQAADKAKAAGPDPAVYEKTVQRGVAFLARSQSPDGSYSKANPIGITAIATTALLRHGRSPDDPVVARSLKYLQGFAQEDGGIYQPGSYHRNYETCLSIMCFSEANKDGRYKDLLKRAEAYVRGLQWDESEEKETSDFEYGGAGYGRHKRPDLSNTTFLIDALKSVGAGADDPAIQKALVFVSRCQNLESEFNTTPFAAKVNDGGFYYTPAAGGTSQAGPTDNGGLRSYASMTYAGLKSMIYAGVGPDDPRVKAAVEWVRKHYNLDSNPGMGQAGLYYYYHTFAKALAAMAVDTFEDDQGKAHDWRAELVAELAQRQRQDGSWLNPTDRWLEGDPALVTSYALLAMSYCKPR